MQLRQQRPLPLGRPAANPGGISGGGGRGGWSARPAHSSLLCALAQPPARISRCAHAARATTPGPAQSSAHRRACRKHATAASSASQAAALTPSLRRRLQRQVLTQPWRPGRRSEHAHARGTWAATARPPRRRAAGVRVLADASCRVRGDAQRVFLYVTDLERWTDWFPGTFA
eukprot:355682-Chlamydomonas_euryale.AAC.3